MTPHRFAILAVAGSLLSSAASADSGTALCKLFRDQQWQAVGETSMASCLQQIATTESADGGLRFGYWGDALLASGEDGNYRSDNGGRRWTPLPAGAASAPPAAIPASATSGSPATETAKPAASLPPAAPKAQTTAAPPAPSVATTAPQETVPPPVATMAPAGTSPQQAAKASAAETRKQKDEARRAAAQSQAAAKAAAAEASKQQDEARRAAAESQAAARAKAAAAKQQQDEARRAAAASVPPAAIAPSARTSASPTDPALASCDLRIGRQWQSQADLSFEQCIDVLAGTASGEYDANGLKHAYWSGIYLIADRSAVYRSANGSEWIKLRDRAAR